MAVCLYVKAEERKKRQDGKGEYSTEGRLMIILACLLAFWCVLCVLINVQPFLHDAHRSGVLTCCQKVNVISLGAFEVAHVILITS